MGGELLNDFVADISWQLRWIPLEEICHRSRIAAFIFLQAITLFGADRSVSAIFSRRYRLESRGSKKWQCPNGRAFNSLMSHIVEKKNVPLYQLLLQISIRRAQVRARIVTRTGPCGLAATIRHPSWNLGDLCSHTQSGPVFASISLISINPTYTSPSRTLLWLG